MYYYINFGFRFHCCYYYYGFKVHIGLGVITSLY